MGQRLQQSVRTVRVSCRQLTFNLILWSILTALWTGTFSPRKSFRRPFRDSVFPIENRDEVKGRSPRGKTGVGLLKRWMDSGEKEAFFASFHRLVRGCRRDEREIARGWIVGTTASYYSGRGMWNFRNKEAHGAAASRTILAYEVHLRVWNMHGPSNGF